MARYKNLAKGKKSLKSLARTYAMAKRRGKSGASAKSYMAAAKRRKK
mgnify:CR=1 FL=1|tara:strand:- start:8118 stop:8258 length:141 start_codon:yes stop_codon:yes gene_type:complete